MQSLFGVKNEEEFKATKQLLSDWLIKTNAYREAILQSLNEHKEHGTKEGNEDTKKTITFLKELLELKTIDIEQAPI
ncbi:MULTISPECIES: hypothetical protein [Priestia]|nr:hypothetical protein [Priestia flexa]